MRELAKRDLQPTEPHAGAWIYERSDLPCGSVPGDGQSDTFTFLTGQTVQLMSNFGALYSPTSCLGSRLSNQDSQDLNSSAGYGHFLLLRRLGIH